MADITRKPYEKPSAPQLTREQAKLKLLDHASRGDQNTRDLLGTLFPKKATELTESKETSA